MLALKVKIIGCFYKEEVGQFFQELNKEVQPEKFEIMGFISQRDKAVVEGRNEGMSRWTRKKYGHDWIMILTIQNGKIVRHRHYYDTSDIISAFRP